MDKNLVRVLSSWPSSKKGFGCWDAWGTTPSVMRGTPRRETTRSRRQEARSAHLHMAQTLVRPAARRRVVGWLVLRRAVRLARRLRAAHLVMRVPSHARGRRRRLQRRQAAAGWSSRRQATGERRLHAYQDLHRTQAAQEQMGNASKTASKPDKIETTGKSGLKTCFNPWKKKRTKTTTQTDEVGRPALGSARTPTLPNRVTSWPRPSDNSETSAPRRQTEQFDGRGAPLARQWGRRCASVRGRRRYQIASQAGPGRRTTRRPRRDTRRPSSSTDKTPPCAGSRQCTPHSRDYGRARSTERAVGSVRTQYSTPHKSRAHQFTETGARARVNQLQYFRARSKGDRRSPARRR